jgi:pimeloyl-ACP methyl ester carboxylesterase
VTSVGPIETQVLRELGAAFDEPFYAPGMRMLRVPQGASDTRVLVLLHGRGHGATVWFPCLPMLAARLPVLAIDLPGFGGSVGGDAPGNANAAARFFVDPIETLLVREYRGYHKARRYVLAGHSLGALVALELALRAQVPVERLILIDAMGLGPTITTASRLFFRLHPERLAHRLGRRRFEQLNPPPATPLGRRVADLEFELLMACSPGRRTAARAFDRLCPLFGAAFHRRDRLREVSVPVLILWGDRDRAIPVSNAIEAAPLVHQVELARFRDLGHSPHLEAPEQVVPRLLEFIA